MGRWRRGKRVMACGAQILQARRCVAPAGGLSKIRGAERVCEAAAYVVSRRRRSFPCERATAARVFIARDRGGATAAALLSTRYFVAPLPVVGASVPATLEDQACNHARCTRRDRLDAARRGDRPAVRRRQQIRRGVGVVAGPAALAREDAGAGGGGEVLRRRHPPLRGGREPQAILLPALRQQRDPLAQGLVGEAVARQAGGGVAEEGGEGAAQGALRRRRGGAAALGHLRRRRRRGEADQAADRHRPAAVGVARDHHVPEPRAQRAPPRRGGGARRVHGVRPPLELRLQPRVPARRRGAPRAGPLGVCDRKLGPPRRPPQGERAGDNGGVPRDARRRARRDRLPRVQDVAGRHVDDRRHDGGRHRPGERAEDRRPHEGAPQFGAILMARNSRAIVAQFADALLSTARRRAGRWHRSSTR